MRKLAILIGLVCIGGVIAFLCGIPRPEIYWTLLAGWTNYLARVIPKVRISQDGLWTGIVCLVLFAGGSHAFLRWIYRELRRPDGGSAAVVRRWSARWTASLIVIILLMFVVGTAAAVVAHQVGWLLSPGRSLTVSRAVNQYYGDSTERLREIAMEGVTLLDMGDQVEPAYWPDEHGRVLHSWMTTALPYLSFYLPGKVDKDRPWNDPANSAYFRGIVPAYLNPEIPVIRSAEGYALAHYAGNVNVLGRPRPWAIRKVTGSLSNTILAGEVISEFKPWGDPTNLRDPVLGINALPGGFGSPSERGANFVFLDGSVRFVRNTTDLKVLRSMASPDAAGPPTGDPSSP
jgi:prepilin-type processing-associated H-X9-DG protein